MLKKKYFFFFNTIYLGKTSFLLRPPSSAHGFDVFLEVSYIKGQAEIGLKSGFRWVLFSEGLTAQWGGGLNVGQVVQAKTLGFTAPPELHHEF